MAEGMKSRARRSTQAPAGSKKALQAKLQEFSLQLAEDEFGETGDPRAAWRAWALARGMKIPIPEWVLTVVDEVAAREVAQHNRARATEDRYREALMQMEMAVAGHLQRVQIRDVAKTFGVAVALSRRDRPNLSAIARAAALAHGVSVTRLLQRYRANLKATRQKAKRTRNS
jgi:hypothetical protein